MRAKRPLLVEAPNLVLVFVRIKVEFHAAILVAKMTVLYDILQIL